LRRSRYTDWSCKENNDAYNDVCRRLTSLCPRLVPRPLWGLSIAKISMVAPQALQAVGEEYQGIATSISRYWRGLNRNGRCEVCGDPGEEWDEDWLYCIAQEKRDIPGEIDVGRGIAYLRRLRLLCKKCHLSKHQGYALVKNKYLEALEHLANINLVKLEEAEILVEKAFETHRYLSMIDEWTIKIGRLRSLDEELRNGVEELLNTMYSGGFSLHQGYLNHSPRDRRALFEVLKRALHETYSILSIATELSREAKTTSDRWIDSLVEIVGKELRQHNIHLLEKEFKYFIKELKLVDNASAHREEEPDQPENTIIELSRLVGKWMIFIPTRQYPKIFRDILDSLGDTGLTYIAKITARQRDYTTKKELPIIIYTPSSIAPRYISEVAEVVGNVLERHQIYVRMYYKPELFTKKGIFSGGTSIKPYIYTFRGTTTTT